MRAAAWHNRVREAALSPAGYSRAIAQAGAMPVLLPPVLPGEAPAPAARPGSRPASTDWSSRAARTWTPRCYGAPLDDRVRGLARLRQGRHGTRADRAAIGTGTPFLAICRGLQVLNVARGGALVNDQPDAAGHDRNRPGGAEPPGREVRISPDGGLGGILGASVTVPACRDRAVGRLGSGITAMAWAAGEVRAAAELTGHRFGIGVHWHPEQGDDLQILSELRAAASPQRASAAAP